MHRYQQQLLCFTLFLALTNAELKITEFKHHGADKTGIYDTRVDLEAAITDCSSCKCDVRTENTFDSPIPLQLADDKKVGTATVSHLKPHTTYKFILTCKETTEGATPVSKELSIQTDFDRPLPPLHIAYEFPTGSLKPKITWQASPTSALISNIEYKVIVDGKEMGKTGGTLYTVQHDYEQKSEHSYNVLTCYENHQKNTICSPDDGVKKAFKVPEVLITTTTTSTSTTTTTTTTITTTTATITTTATEASSANLSYSISIVMLIISLFLCMQMK